ncbi:MAG: hypothetical protein AABX01_02945 [Candidatus Micrarchaeota archaeon]
MKNIYFLLLLSILLFGCVVKTASDKGERQLQDESYQEYKKCKEVNGEASKRGVDLIEIPQYSYHYDICDFERSKVVCVGHGGDENHCYWNQALIYQILREDAVNLCEKAGDSKSQCLIDVETLQDMKEECQKLSSEEALKCLKLGGTLHKEQAKLRENVFSGTNLTEVYIVG